MTDQGWAHPELLTTSDWVAEHVADDNVVVVDCDLLPAYQRLHIPGAVAARSRYWKGDGNDTDLFGIDGDKFAEHLGKMGIGNDDTIVAYDGSGGVFAARFWWTLDRYGHTNAMLLDGGLDQWVADGRPLSRENYRPKRKSYSPGAQNNHWTCGIADVAGAAADPNVILWDVRSDGEWTGANKRGTKRGGRIPGAVHLEWLKLLNEPVRTLRPPAEIRSELDGLGVTPEKRVTTY